MNDLRQPAHTSRLLLLPLLVAAVCVSSCSVLKKSKLQAEVVPGAEAGGILNALPIHSDISEETVANLKAIADNPASSLPPLAEKEEQIVSAPETRLPPPAPRTDWKQDGLNPASIFPGDIFYENMGPYLHKVASLIDPIATGERSSALSSIATPRNRRMPMTLSVAELEALRSESPPEFELPSRSVAFDIAMRTWTSTQARLEAAFENALTGTGASPDASPAERKIRKQLEEVCVRLKRGDELCVIVSVTQSEEVKGNYPGAPLGKRDIVLIKNALESLYPHLDSLKATKETSHISITRDPLIYWEFDVRKLSIADGRIHIDSEAFAVATSR